MLDPILSGKGHSSPLLFLLWIHSASSWLNGFGKPEAAASDNEDNAALETVNERGGKS